MRILLVEDDRDVKALEELLLTNHKVPFDSVDNIADACELFRKNYYDVIILDIKLEPFDKERCEATNGLELCISMRDYEARHPARQRAKIVAITGLIPIQKTKVDLRIAGFDEVFDKPMDFKDLYHYIIKNTKGED